MDQTGYHVVLEPNPGGGYLAVVPAFPGCYSQGETEHEALANAREVRQRGSHLRLRHPTNARPPLTVPDHAEPGSGDEPI